MYRVQLQAIQQRTAATRVPFAPPLFAIITEAGLKVIEKQDGSLEVFDLRQDMEEKNDLAPGLSFEALENFRAMLRVLKEETGFDLKRDEILKSFQGKHGSVHH